MPVVAGPVARHSLTRDGEEGRVGGENLSIDSVLWGRGVVERDEFTADVEQDLYDVLPDEPDHEWDHPWLVQRQNVLKPSLPYSTVVVTRVETVENRELGRR